MTAVVDMLAVDMAFTLILTSYERVGRRNDAVKENWRIVVPDGVRIEEYGRRQTVMLSALALISHSSAAKNGSPPFCICSNRLSASKIYYGFIMQLVQKSGFSGSRVVISRSRTNYRRGVSVVAKNMA